MRADASVACGRATAKLVLKRTRIQNRELKKCPTTDNSGRPVLVHLGMLNCQNTWPCRRASAAMPPNHADSSIGVRLTPRLTAPPAQLYSAARYGGS